MSIENTLAIIKPDAVAAGSTGKIIDMIESSDFEIVAMKKAHLSSAQAQGFYAVHSERPFFSSLIEFMTSGPVFVSVLEGENAIARYREVLGATNPAEADAGTVRALYGTDIEKNAAHGSDGPDTAKTEISFFFEDGDIVG